MNYQEFKVYKEQAIQQQPLLRLDCMNPFKAMSFLKHQPSSSNTCSSSDVLDLWVENMKVEQYREFAIPSGGVRESLKGLFKIFAAHGKDLWLPEDVYPFYWEAARKAGFIPQSFPTIPKIELSLLNNASANSVAVITNPVSPLGRKLNSGEVAQIKNWLKGSRHRQLIIDAVYSYTHGFDNFTIELFETGQCFIAHSLSKSWLQRGVFGVLLPPRKDSLQWKKFLQPPSGNNCHSAFAALEKQSDLPMRQQASFSREWKKLAPAIQKIDPEFQIPETGYFSVIKAKHDQVLEQFGAIVVPATVFGSPNKEFSIISCLYSIS